MRIIAGKNKRLNLYTLQGPTTRPMMDRMKESVFNTLAPWINEDAIVLDLFAGSGALGLEALSRGVKHSYFIEIDKEALEVVSKNVKKMKEEYNSTILNIDYKEALAKFKKDENKFDIVFLDPPYKLNVINEIMNKLLANNSLNDKALIICHAMKNNISKDLEQFEELKNKNFGHSEVFIFRKK